MAKKLEAAGARHAKAFAARSAARSAWRSEKAHYDELRAVNAEIEDVERDAAQYARKNRHADAAELRESLAPLKRRRERIMWLEPGGTSCARWMETCVPVSACIALMFAPCLPMRKFTSGPFGTSTWIEALLSFAVTLDGMGGRWYSATLA